MNKKKKGSLSPYGYDLGQEDALKKMDALDVYLKG